MICKEPDLLNYVKQHAKRTKHPGIWKVTRPIYVFKKTKETTYYKSAKVIVNLVIPPGALIHIYDFYFKKENKLRMKCRASYAYVFSQFKLYNKKEVTKSYSGYYHSFIYKTGEYIIPDSFDKTDIICSNGIHFFFNLSEAKQFKF